MLLKLGEDEAFVLELANRPEVHLAADRLRVMHMSLISWAACSGAIAATEFSPTTIRSWTNNFDIVSLRIRLFRRFVQRRERLPKRVSGP